jgi:Flp pilus assembly protein protease CpaA
MNLGMAGSLIVCAWLAVCAAYDLKSRAVPAWLTIPPLLGAVVWSVWQGSWAISLLILTLVCLDDLPWRLRGFLAGLQGLLLLFAWQQAGLEGVSLGLTLLGIWLSWKLGAFGGADAQVLMALSLFFGPAIIVPVALMNAIQGLAGMMMKRKTIPAMLSILAGACIFFAVQALS